MASDTTHVLRNGQRVSVPGRLVEILLQWPAERRFIDQISGPAIAMLRLSEAKKLSGPEEVAMRQVTQAVARLRANQMQIEGIIRDAIRRGLERGDLTRDQVNGIEAWARPTGLGAWQLVVVVIAAMIVIGLVASYGWQSALNAWNVYEVNKAAARLAADRNNAIIQNAIARNQAPPELPDSQVPQPPGGGGSDPLDTLAKGASGALMLLALGAVAFLFLNKRKAG